MPRGMLPNQRQYDTSLRLTQVTGMTRVAQVLQ